jgi:hypothetical protein
MIMLMLKIKSGKSKIASQDVNIKSGLEALLSCPKNDIDYNNI